MTRKIMMICSLNSLAFILFFTFVGCMNSGRRRVCAIDVNDTINIQIYQERSFEEASWVSYSIRYDGQDQAEYIDLFPFSDDIKGCEYFNIFQSENLIYITFLDTNSVCAIYDLKSGIRTKHGLYNDKKIYQVNDSLFNILHKINPSLQNSTR